MTPRARKHLLKPLVLILAAVALEGCISPMADSVGRYTSPIGGAPVISNETPYSAALRCMGGFVAQRPVRTCENSTIIEFDSSVGEGSVPAERSSPSMILRFCMSVVRRQSGTLPTSAQVTCSRSP